MFLEVYLAVVAAGITLALLSAIVQSFKTY